MSLRESVMTERMLRERERLVHDEFMRESPQERLVEPPSTALRDMHDQINQAYREVMARCLFSSEKIVD
jgi:hypothetical protein